MFRIMIRYLAGSAPGMAADAVSGCNMYTFFDTIMRCFTAHGYKMPKLVFWNVNSRTNVIPVLSNELEPYACLKKVLDGERYRKVEERLCS